MNKYMVVSLITNMFLSAIKIVVGFISKSSAIVSDGFHSFSDLITDIVAIIGIKLSNKKEDKEHPLGHGKFEYITSLIVGFVIVFFAYELLMKVLNGENSVPNIIGIYVIFFTIIAKLFLSNFLIKKGKKYDNQIIYSSGKESMNDVYSSIVVLIGLILSQFDFSFSLYIDKITSILIVLLIVKTGIIIIINNINLLLGENASSEEMKEIEDKILREIEEVRNCRNLALLKYGPYYKVIVDIQVDKNSSVVEGHDIAKKTEKLLMKDKKINYVKVHVEPYMKK